MRDEKLFLALLTTSGAHWERIRKDFDHLGLTEGQPKILYILKRNEGIKQKELALMCGIRESTLTVLLRRMEGLGFVEKTATKASTGKAAKIVTLTAKGRLIAEEVDTCIDHWEEKSFQGFSKEERDQVFALLERVRMNLKE